MPIGSCKRANCPNLAAASRAKVALNVAKIGQKVRWISTHIKLKRMKRIVVLGAGTAGTIMANKLHKLLGGRGYEIVVVDRSANHYYQPGFLFIPFGMYQPADVVRPKADFLRRGVVFREATVGSIDTQANTLTLDGGETLPYDVLIVATGAVPTPSETPGYLGERWYKSIFDFYTFEGAVALHEHLRHFTGGRLVMTITELPFKCPVAPLEFVFLADAYFTQRGIRDRVEIVYTTPLSGAFTKPIATRMLSSLLAQKNISVVTDFYVEGVDEQQNLIRSYDGREVPFDTLVVVPVNLGDAAVANSNLADDMGYVRVDKETMQSTLRTNVFAIGDAANLPTSKAGSVAHFAADVLIQNVADYLAGCPLSRTFDGHANCFIETGFGRATLIDFDYTHEPYGGRYPLPGLGPMELLGLSRVNHWGKLAFKTIYWEFLLKDRKLPVSSQFSMAGKRATN